MQGTSGFATEFAAIGPRDRAGHSLRDLDLEHRIFRYPCSFLIYSEAWDSMPPAVKDRLYQRLWEVLTGKDQSAKFSHLSPGDRSAILDILRATKKGLPDYY